MLFVHLEQSMANTEIALLGIAKEDDTNHTVCEAQRKVMGGDLCS